MSVDIHYDRADPRPFPFVNLAVSRPERDNYEPWLGKIDTGASITAVPKNLVDALDLWRVGDMPVKSFDGSVRRYGRYMVDIKIGDILRKDTIVIATRRDNVLVGRDLINSWRMILDGPSLTGTMTLF